MGLAPPCAWFDLAAFPTVLGEPAQCWGWKGHLPSRDPLGSLWRCGAICTAMEGCCGRDPHSPVRRRKGTRGEEGLP